MAITSTMKRWDESTHTWIPVIDMTTVVVQETVGNTVIIGDITNIKIGLNSVIFNYTLLYGKVV